MQKLIYKLENIQIGIVPWLMTFFAIVVLRILFESFSGNGLALFSIHELFLVPPLYYAGVLLSFAILIRIITKVEMLKALNLVLIGFIISPFGPIIDYILSGGKGSFQQHYLFDPLPTLVKDYFTFFGPGFRAGATYGLRFVALIGILGVSYYIYIKTHIWWKVLVGAIATYTISFIFGSFAGILAILLNLPKNPWHVTQLEMFQKLWLPRDIFALKYDPSKILQLVDVEIALVFIPLVFMLLLVVLYLWDKKKFIGFIKKLRYLRLFLHIIAVNVGLLTGLYIYKAEIDQSFFGVMAQITIFLIAAAIWVLSLTTNDRNDIAIDKISNPDRLLVTGVFEPREFTGIAILSLVFSIIASLALGENFTFLILGNAVLAYLYSYKPLRLRRFPIIAPLMMSFGIAFLLLFGYLLASPSSTFTDFPTTYLALLVFVIALIINVKDIKDIEGDSHNGVYTIPTIFGDRYGKIIISLLFTLSYLLFPIVLRTKSLTFIAILFSLFTALLINRKKVHEGYIFAVYYLFFVVAAFTLL